jgi:subtilisin family serine protease
VSRTYLRRPRGRFLAALASTAIAGATLYATAGGPVGASPGGSSSRGTGPAKPIATAKLSPELRKAAIDVAARKLAARREGVPAAANGPAAAGAVGPVVTPGRAVDLPAGGSVSVLVQLTTASTFSAYDHAGGARTSAARKAAIRQYARVKAAQDVLARRIGRAAPGSTELYRTHSVLAGVAVRTDARNVAAIGHLPGVKAVFPITPKHATNSYAVPLVGAPDAWVASNDLGEESTIAVIDTGIDFTHANFGGPGTVNAYTTAKAADATDADPDLFPNAKIIGGADFAGDAYDADSTDPAKNTPHADTNPLDCNGHGSHVAGTAAGYGEAANGSTYAGAYNLSTPFSTMRIGPGVAPAALLYAYKVFGCDGSTNVVAAAIDRATDPNDDGDPSDHADVINMSLGADFGSPQDGDSMAANMAVDKGVTVVAASGNAGDTFDVGGSPGDASKVLTVANSVDALNQVDSLTLSAPVALARDHAAERSIAYDWANDPDLAGNVAKLSQSTNLDGCDALNSADATAVNGKIAFLEWNSDDATRRCGSVARAARVETAGAIGFIFADDEETFSAGITGSATIPGVMVVKSSADAIRASLAASNTVTVTGTGANDFRQLITADNDKVNDSSSRGVRLAGNVKPDVTAVGTSVFSTAVGTGTEGASFTGTSMATPMVAGAAALVRAKHRDWTPQEVKADIVNTAGQDLFTGDTHTGTTYAPNRVGSGRIQVDEALANQVLAYVVNDPGAVSVSFGPVAITEPTTLTKTVKVVNKGIDPVTYSLAYEAITTVPGVAYSVFPTSVTVDRRASKTFTVTMTVANPALLTKTLDPTVARTIPAGDSGDLPRNFLADASGRVTLTSGARCASARISAGAATCGSPTLRVPVYAAPRPASMMTQPGTVNLSGEGAVQTAALPLGGVGVNVAASTDAAIQSIVTAAELQAVSGQSPVCSQARPFACLRIPEERSADIKYLGSTSDAPAFVDPMDGLAYFAIATHGPWQTEVSKQEFDVYIDSTGTGDPDTVLFTTRLVAGQDVFVTMLVDLNASDPDAAVLDIEPINGELGDVDTAEFNSDTLVLPVAIQAIPGITSSRSRIRYGVYGFSGYAAPAVDMIGINPVGTLTNPLSMDVLRPGVTLANPDAQSILFQDLPNTSLPLRRDAPAYKVDKGMGAMLIHFHNRVGMKAQLVGMRSASDVGLALSAREVRAGTPVIAAVGINPVVGTATGYVSLRRAPGITLANARLEDGEAGFVLRLGRGRYDLYVFYPGDDNYRPGYSNHVILTVS